jgi:hypothetical protein
MGAWDEILAAVPQCQLSCMEEELPNASYTNIEWAAGFM